MASLNKRTNCSHRPIGAARWPGLLGAAQAAGAEDGPGETGSWTTTIPLEVRGMLRCRANTIEGGTSEVNKNVLGEKVLGLPREPDPYVDSPWQEVPRS